MAAVVTTIEIGDVIDTDIFVMLILEKWLKYQIAFPQETWNCILSLASK